MKRMRLSVAVAFAAALVATHAYGLQRPADFNQWTDAQKEEYLTHARVGTMRGIGTGKTGTRRAELNDGEVRHDAHFQSVDDYRPGLTSVPGGVVEINFQDSYKFNIAGYRLDRLLNLNMVPVSIERRVARETGALTWWVDGVRMMYLDMYEQGISPPNAAEWNDQMYLARLFTQLIYNTDPNLGNFLITDDWKIRMIDFTRAFRTHETLRSPESLPPRVTRAVYNGLRMLDRQRLTDVMEDLLDGNQIDALLTRRDIIVEHLERQIAEKGESAVFFDPPGEAD